MNSSEKDIIIAEDDADDLLFFELAIKETQVPVRMRHAKNGDVLFVLLEERIPELLFLDIHMPCKDGVACIREIRQMKQYDNLPVIMFTSETYQKTIEECFRNNANFYLLKPTRFMDLSEKLKMIFSMNWKQSMNYPPLEQFVL